MLPTFVVIGAMKCGTTSLYRYLQQHPEICMSRTKEPNFFVEEKNYHKGMAWYQSLFQGSAKEYGECSTNYTKRHEFEGVAARMKAVLPDVKLIYLLRDPVERVISHYVHSYAKGTEHRALSDVLCHFDNNKYVLTSRYYMQLQPYLSHYSTDQILVISTEALKLNRLAVLQEVFRFVGVDPTFECQTFSQKFNQSSAKKRKSLLDRIISNKGLKNLIRPILPSYVTEAHSFTRPELDHVTKERLIEYLSTDVEQLRRVTGKQFDRWCL